MSNNQKLIVLLDKMLSEVTNPEELAYNNKMNVIENITAQFNNIYQSDTLVIEYRSHEYYLLYEFLSEKFDKNLLFAYDEDYYFFIEHEKAKKQIKIEQFSRKNKYLYLLLEIPFEIIQDAF